MSGMSANTIRFLIGLSIPLGISAIWFGVVKALVSPTTAARLYNTAPMKYVSPAVMLGIICLLALVNWRARRWIAYGALATLLPVLPITIAFLIGNRPT
jgi:hypothetical protein